MITLFRLIISAVLALIATLLLQLATVGTITAIDPMTVTILFVACLSAALISPALGQRADTHASNHTATASAKGRERGTVKWFNVSKGYGFVTRQSGEDVFVHFRSIRGKGRRVLREGQSVEFVVAAGDKGPQAEDVEPLSEK